MTVLANVRTLTEGEVIRERQAVKDQSRQSGVEIEDARLNPRDLTAEQAAAIEEYDDLGWLLNPDA